MPVLQYVYCIAAACSIAMASKSRRPLPTFCGAGGAWSENETVLFPRLSGEAGTSWWTGACMGPNLGDPYEEIRTVFPINLGRGGWNLGLAVGMTIVWLGEGDTDRVTETGIVFSFLIAPEGGVSRARRRLEVDVSLRRCESVSA